MADEVKENIDFSDIQLSGSTATWEMRMEGSLSGTFSGTFKFRCFLTPLQKIAAGREQRQLLGESRAFIETPEYESEAYMAYALTQLKYRIISAPPWWSASGVNKPYEGDIPDEEIIDKVLGAAMRAQLKYVRDIKERREAAVKRANEGAEALKKDLEEEPENPDEPQ